MAFQIVWTKQALNGFNRIINYLNENWSDKEIIKFIEEADKFFELLSIYPELLQKTEKRKNTFRGPLNSLTIITYRIKPNSEQIELISIRSSRQKPLK